MSCLMGSLLEGAECQISLSILPLLEGDKITLGISSHIPNYESLKRKKMLLRCKYKPAKNVNNINNFFVTHCTWSFPQLSMATEQEIVSVFPRLSLLRKDEVDRNA